MHVLFGYDGKCEQGDHFVFDLDTLRWSRLHGAAADRDHHAKHPPARSVTDVVYLPGVGSGQGSLFVFGGEFTPSAQGHVVTRVLVRLENPKFFKLIRPPILND